MLEQEDLPQQDKEIMVVLVVMEVVVVVQEVLARSVMEEMEFLILLLDLR